MTEVNSVGVPLVETRGGTNQTSLSIGDILYSDATDSLSKLAKGDEDQVLKMGASNIPEWGAGGGAGGGVAFLSSATAATSASLDFASSIDSTYNCYMFVIDEISPAIDGASLYVRTSSDGGSNFDVGASDYGWNDVTQGVTGSSGSSTFIRIITTIGNNTSESCWGCLYLVNPSASSHYTRTTCLGGHTTAAGNIAANHSSGTRKSAGAVDAIQFLMSSGNIASGTISMYGMTTPS